MQSEVAMSQEKEYFGEYPWWLRLTVLPWYIWLALIVTAIWATSAAAEEIPLHVLEKQGVEIRLMNTPCVDPVSLSLILPDKQARFKAIYSVWPERDGSKKVYAGCWTELSKEEAQAEETVFLLVFEDMQTGAVPKSEFNKKSGQSGV